MALAAEYTGLVLPEDHAKGLGYTKRLMATGGGYDLELLVQPDSDLDGAFRAWECAEEEWLVINGWLFTLEDC